MHRLRTATLHDVSTVAGHHAMPAALLFPFGFDGRMLDLIVLVPDHCLSFYFMVSFAFYPHVDIMATIKHQTLTF